MGCSSALQSPNPEKKSIKKRDMDYMIKRIKQVSLMKCKSTEVAEEA